MRKLMRWNFCSVIFNHTTGLSQAFGYRSFTHTICSCPPCVMHSEHMHFNAGGPLLYQATQHMYINCITNEYVIFCTVPSRPTQLSHIKLRKFHKYIHNKLLHYYLDKATTIPIAMFIIAVLCLTLTDNR